MSGIRIFHQGVQAPEGPAQLVDGSWVITEMNAGVISHLSPGGKIKTQVAQTGRPNGIAVDNEGVLWVAEASQRALLRVIRAGQVDVISRGLPDAPFLWPNDLCFGPDGMLYLTDSGTVQSEFSKITPRHAIYDAPFDGKLIRVDPRSGETNVLDTGYQWNRVWSGRGIPLCGGDDDRADLPLSLVG